MNNTYSIYFRMIYNVACWLVEGPNLPSERKNGGYGPFSRRFCWTKVGNQGSLSFKNILGTSIHLNLLLVCYSLISLLRSFFVSCFLFLSWVLDLFHPVCLPLFLRFLLFFSLFLSFVISFFLIFCLHDDFDVG